MKRLAMFMDGTWNKPEANTSVWRTKLLVADKGADETRQVVYYREGVGSKWYTRFHGGASGAGLSANVTDAYGWLMEHYSEGDQVFLFGFSRGAFTARTLAGMSPGAGCCTPELHCRWARSSGTTGTANRAPPVAAGRCST